MQKMNHAPKTGILYAMLRDRIIFEEYTEFNVETGCIYGSDRRILLDIEEQQTQGSLLELHLFDNQIEYRCIKKRLKGYQEYVIQDTNEYDDIYVESVYLTGDNVDKQEHLKEKIDVVNYIRYNDDDILTIVNYRLQQRGEC